MRTPDSRLTYTLLWLILTFVSMGMVPIGMEQARATQTSPEQTQTILVLGDSLSAAYGIPKELGWAALLEKQLQSQNLPYQIVNASISGETTDGGVRNLPRLLQHYQPGIVIIELGANDGLRGFPIKTIETNLRKLITMSQNSGAQTLVIGMHIPPNYGKRYAQAFHQLFGKLASETNSAHLPFLLDGVAIKPELMQQDRLHPKAEAQPMLLNLVWAKLQPLL